MAKGRLRLDQLLLDRGFFRDSKLAQAWILAGKVVVEGKVVSAAGTAVRSDAAVHVRDLPEKFASRGGFKLEAALTRFAVDVRGLTVLDAGASTGGFTDCLLSQGAAKVYAVDVGYGQLRGKLAADPRVVSMEKTNISDIPLAALQPAIDLCVFDLSYLSFASAVDILRGYFERPVHLIGLIKPMYEGIAQEAMRDETVLRGVLGKVVRDIAEKGLVVTRLISSPIAGGMGAFEFLAEIEPNGTTVSEAELDLAIAEVPRTAPAPES